MSTDNPFEKLVGTFSDKTPKEQRSSSLSRTTGHAVAKGRARKATPETPQTRTDESGKEDRVLFLDAVRPTRPQRPASETPDEDFASLMEADSCRLPPSAQDGPRKTVSAASGRHFAAPVEETPPQDAEYAFVQAMHGVTPLFRKGRDVAPAAAPVSAPAVDPARPLRDLLEGRPEFALTHSDEYLEGFVSGLDPSVPGRLRAGAFSPEAHLDLHGQNAQQAFDALSWFIRHAYMRGLRTVIIVTGRGKNSPNGMGVLRPLLPEWLTKDPFKRVVLAFCTARPADGGPGSVYVLLRKHKKKQGKITWDHHMQ